MRAATKRRLAKYWGYVLLVVLFFGWFYIQLDPVVLIIISGLVVIYTLFQAPVPCCAKTREYEFCRNNASGLLRGCHLEAHKWQNLRMLARQHAWARVARGIFRRVSGNAAALAAIAGMVSAVAATAQVVVRPAPALVVVEGEAEITDLVHRLWPHHVDPALLMAPAPQAAQDFLR